MFCHNLNSRGLVCIFNPIYTSRQSDAFHPCIADFLENGTTYGSGPKTKRLQGNQNIGKARQA